MQANKLLGKIKENGFTQDDIAEKAGMSRSTLYLKIKGATEFTRDEIMKISKILSLSDDELLSIFFAN